MLELSNGKIINYLPDYFIPHLDAYIEIKLAKNPTHDECLRCCLLAQQTNKDVFMFYEIVGKKNTNAYKYFAGSGAFMPLMRWTECPTCSVFGITYQGRVSELRCGCCKEKDDVMNDNSHAIQEAVRVVRSERFGA